VRIKGKGVEGKAVEGKTVEEVLRLYPKIFLACHTRHVRDSVTGQQLSDHQASILDHLDEVEPTSLMELARHLGVTASTMSLTIDRLVRAGYVSRQRAAQDGRVVALRLTEAGLRIRREKSVLDPTLVRSMLARLTADELEQALRGLEILARASAQLMESRSSRSLVKRRPLPEREKVES
jgi:DNA-binding MarR family transcriptional regulator